MNSSRLPHDALGAIESLASQIPGLLKRSARVFGNDLPHAASGRLGLGGERMSKVDTAWLRMDSPHNLMMINGVWMLSPGVNLHAARERVRERLLSYPRFRQRVEQDAAGATWVEDDDLDLDYHVPATTLPGRSSPRRKGSDEAALQELVGQLAMQPLDPRRPLWQWHVIEDYRGADGRRGSAIILRMHHCIADGMALISVVMTLIDGGHARARRAAHAFDGPQEWIAQQIVKPLTGVAVRALGRAGKRAADGLHLLATPEEGVERTLDAARMAAQVASDAANLLLMPDDSPTSLKGQAGTAKRVAWCRPLPLDEVKAVGRALNCSVNDVLLACVAGAIGAYLQGRGERTAGKVIRAMVPVNLRPLSEAYKLGNRFGLAPLTLPIGLKNPIERVYEVRRRMSNLKGSMQPALTFAVLAVAGVVVKPAQDALLDLLARKTTAVMTNVPGPADKHRFCGSTIDHMMFWVPQSGNIGLGVSILSYGGEVQFGVITDTHLCPHPQAIIDEFEPEFARLSLLTLMLPWGEAA